MQYSQDTFNVAKPQHQLAFSEDLSNLNFLQKKITLNSDNPNDNDSPSQQKIDLDTDPLTLLQQKISLPQMQFLSGSDILNGGG